MNLMTRLKGISVTLLGLALLTCLATGACLFSPAQLDAAPQDESESMILQYGPDRNMFTSESLEAVLHGWKWQLEVSNVQQQLVEETIDLWEQRLQVNQAEINLLQKELASAGVPSSIDGKSVTDIHQAIRLHRGELSGLEAKLRAVEQQVKDNNATLQMERNSARREITLLTQKVDLATVELERTKSLFEKGVVSKREMASLESKVAGTEANLRDSQERLQLIDMRIKSGQKGDLVALMQQMQSVERSLKDLERQKTMIEKTKPLQQMGRLQREINMATRMLEVAHMKQLELQLENTRNRALILLTEKRLAKAMEKSAESKKGDD